MHLFVLRDQQVEAWDICFSVNVFSICVKFIAFKKKLQNFFFLEIDDGLHFVPKPQYIIDQNAIKEFFLFADGVVVFWGINHIEVIVSFFSFKNHHCHCKIIIL